MTVTSTRPASTARPKLYVLAAGVNAYRAAGLVQLEFAKADATAIGGALQRAAGRLYDSIEVTTLLDQDVTAAKLDDAFTRLATKVTPDDVFVLYLSGHGVTTDGRFYYIPQDYTYGQAEIATKAISQEQLQDWFVRIPAQRAVLMVDACQSGSLAEDQVTRSGVEQYTSTQHLNEAIGRAVLSATTDDKPAGEGIGGHGVFTYALLAGLTQADTNNDGLVDIGELGKFVQVKVPELTGRWWHVIQAPQVKLAGASFPLAAASSDPLVAALPDTAPVVLASATHLLNGSTVIRQFGNGAAIDVANLETGAKVRVIQTRGDWNLVAQNGRIIGYVEADKLKAIGETDKDASTCDQLQGTFVVVNVPWEDSDHGVVLRSTASTRAQATAMIPGDAIGLTVSNCDGNWCQVSYNCRNGWINSRYLSDQSRQYRNVAGVSPQDPEGLNVRGGPGQNYPKIGSIPYNATRVITHVCQTGANHSSWCLVTYKNVSGWVSGVFLAF
jgi:uncharacterized protein YraI